MRGIAGLSPGAVGASGKKHCIGNGKQKEVELCPFLKIPASPQVLAGRSMMGQAQEKAERLHLQNVTFQQGDVGALPFAVHGGGW